MKARERVSEVSEDSPNYGNVIHGGSHSETRSDYRKIGYKMSIAHLIVIIVIIIVMASWDLSSNLAAWEPSRMNVGVGKAAA